MLIITFSKIKKNIKDYINLAKSLKRDKKVPKISRILIGLAIAYFFMPIDIIPDFIPVIGHLDDAIIILSLISVAIKFIPKEIFSEHYRRIFKKMNK